MPAAATINDVSIPVPGAGRLPAALAMPARPRPAGVIVLHEAFGLNDDMRRIAWRFAAAGYPTLAPDFIDGLGPKPICIARFVRMIDRPGTRPYRQLDVARAWLAANSAVAGGPIGVAGFCMGGGFAILYASRGDVAVVAPFYAPFAEDTPIGGICPVVASYGGRDEVFGDHGQRLAASLARAGVEHDVRTYPEAGHSFMSRHDGLSGFLGPRVPLRAAYSAEAAEDAWARTLAFFERYLAA